MKINKMVLPFVLCGTMLGTMVSCGSKDLSDSLITEQIEIDIDNDVYEVKNSIPKFYQSLDIKDYRMIMYDNHKYESTCSVEEFKKYSDKENITWNDIRNTLNANNKLTDGIKKVLLKGIDNLEKNNLNIDLYVLDYNLKNLDMVLVESINDTTNGEAMSAARFESYENKVYFNKELLQYYDEDNLNFLLCHEILGHGSIEAYYKDGKNMIRVTPTMNTIIKENEKVVEYGCFGYGFNEALADYVAFKATNILLDNNNLNGVYNSVGYYLQIILKSQGITYEEYINKGSKCLIDKIKENDLEETFDYINKLDLKLQYLFCAGIDYGYYMDSLIVSYMKYLIDNNVLSIDEINEILDSYNGYIKPMEFNRIDAYCTLKLYSGYTEKELKEMQHLINRAEDNHPFLTLGIDDLEFIDIDLINDYVINYYDENNKTK